MSCETKVPQPMPAWPMQMLIGGSMLRDYQYCYLTCAAATACDTTLAAAISDCGMPSCTASARP